MPDTRQRHDIHVSSAILAADLTYGEKVAYMAVRSFQGKNDWTWAQQPAIADAMGTSRSQLSRYITALEEAGWVVRKSGRMRCLDEATPRTESAQNAQKRAENATDDAKNAIPPCAENAQGCAENAQGCAENASPSESQHLKPTLKANNDDDDAREAISFRRSEIDWSFLYDKRDRPHLPAIQAEAERTDPSDRFALSRLAARRWGRRSAMPPHDLKPVLAEHPPPVVLAALIEAGDDPNPNKPFFHSILSRIHAQHRRIASGQGPEKEHQEERSAQHSARRQSRVRGDGADRRKAEPPRESFNWLVQR